MVFFVYLDLSVFKASATDPDSAMRAICSTLRALLQNCILLDFDDWRWGQAVGEALENGEGVFARSQVKKLLVQFRKRKRIAPVLQARYSNTTDLALAAEQAKEAKLDLIIAQAGNAGSSSPVASTTVEDYSESAFESERGRLATYGVELKPGQFDGESLLDKYFGKALMFATSIEVFDRLLGSKFGDSYEHTLKLLFKVLARSLAEPDTVDMILHCERSNRDDHLQERLSKLRPKELAHLKLSVRFYENAEGGACLPHERYLITDQFAFQIGRGLDLVDRKTGKNRDISISLKDGQVLREEKLEAYKRFSLAPVSVRI